VTVPDDFDAQVSGVAALAEPARRALYMYVGAQPDAVSRDDAAEGVGVPRHTAKFHLDKLVREGLLTTEFRRLGGRRGPGAGRPSKLYRRSDTQLSVSLPDRTYQLAGQLMAKAIDASQRTGAPVVEALHRAAADFGTALGDRERPAATTTPVDVRVLTCRVLAGQGYEPRAEGQQITLRNCPFHALAQDHTELVCGMNLVLVGSLTERLDPRLAPRLSPAGDRCCVVIDVQ
jgi:predicted ArsR family transcriptional regulator